MNIKKIVLLAMLTVGISVSAQASEVVAANSSNFTNLCMTAIAGNRAAMHNDIKSSGYSQKFIAKNVECNGINILAFVQQYGKNSDAMLRILDRGDRSTSITDLAKNNSETQ
jgi:hypothetical protein